MIKLDDYRNDNGQVDFGKYIEAQKQVGERCTKCGTCIFGIKVAGEKLSGPTECISCKSLHLGTQLWHETIIRCPYCRFEMNVNDGDLWEDGIFEEGDHEVFCVECDKKFTFTTAVSYTYKSPHVKA